MGAVFQGRGTVTAVREFKGYAAGFYWVEYGIPGFVECGTCAVVDDFGNLVRV